MPQIVSAIGITKNHRFPLHIEGILSLGIGNHFHGIFVEGVEADQVALGIDISADVIEIVKEIASAGKSIDINLRRKAEVSNLEPFHVWIIVWCERIVRSSKVGCFTKVQQLGKIHIRGHAGIVCALHFRNHRTKRGEDIIVHFNGWLIAGKHPLRTHAMACIGMASRTKDGKLIHDFCLKGQMLANLDARHIGRNGLEFATNLGWRIGL